MKRIFILGFGMTWIRRGSSERQRDGRHELKREKGGEQRRIEGISRRRETTYGGEESKLWRNVKKWRKPRENMEINKRKLYEEREVEKLEEKKREEKKDKKNKEEEKISQK